MKAPTVILRADADREIGAGHVMRGLAVLQAWRDRTGSALWITAADPSPFTKLFAREGVRIQRIAVPAGSRRDAEETARMATEGGADWIVVDGYRFGAEYCASLSLASSARTILVDDFGQHAEAHADMVVNPNVTATRALYPDLRSGARLLLGPRFAMLRRNFAHARRRRDWQPVARHILVSLGGAAPSASLTRLLAAFRRLTPGSFEATIVAGLFHSADPLLETVRGVTLVPALDEMAAQMAWADVALIGSGSTALEAMCLGLPSLLLIMARNQAAIAVRLEELGAARNLGWHADVEADDIHCELERLLLDAGARERLSRRAAALVDGRGAERLASQLRSRLRLVRATPDHMRLFWEWANDPVTRSASFSSSPIHWEDHQRWFRQKLADPACILYVALDRQGRPLGQARYEITGERALISVGLAPDARGLGLGTELIEISVEEMLQSSVVLRIDAYVKPDNHASLNAFRKAGFGGTRETRVGDQVAVCMTLERVAGLQPEFQ